VLARHLPVKGKDSEVRAQADLTVPGMRIDEHKPPAYEGKSEIRPALTANGIHIVGAAVIDLALGCVQGSGVRDVGSVGVS